MLALQNANEVSVEVMEQLDVADKPVWRDVLWSGAVGRSVSPS